MNKQIIWIMNHYATNMFFNKGGRHYWFAKYLLKNNYKPTIFCANTRHSRKDVVEIKSGKFQIKVTDGIPYVFVKTTGYKGNGFDRIKNMWSFYKNLFPTAKEYAKMHGKPDIILASSVHPLTLVAGIKIAQKFGIPCICEVRDLWPESLVAYNVVKKNSPLLRLLYSGEKWIYKKADKLIFTMEGGKDYIIEKGWDKQHGGPVDLSKAYHINNGVDLEGFECNCKDYVFEDEDLGNEDIFKIVYTGSIRLVNNVKSIIDAAQVNNGKHSDNIIFLMYGDGNDREYLERYCIDNNIKNVRFKGFVDKKRIPYILSKSNLNIIHFEQNCLKKYGASLNKMFEYFASGKPTVSDCEFGYDLIRRYNCGIVVDNADAVQLAEAILSFYYMEKDEYRMYCKNALMAAQDYDFKALTVRLEQIIQDI